jgi:hypothetical protein
MKNVVCRKKPHQIWPNGLGDMALWSSRFSEIDSIITCQPHMGIESSRTFWIWENKIFNFHVGQKFIWGLYHDVSLRIKTFHLWQVSVTGPVSVLGNSWSGFKFFHDGVWHDIWWLFGHEWTLTNQFQSSNHWLNGQLTNSWLLGFLSDCALTDDFQTLIPWEFDFKWCPKLYELLIIDHGAQIPQEWPPSTALTDSWLSLTFDCLCMNWWPLSLQPLTWTLQMDLQVMWTCWTNPRAFAPWETPLLDWLTDLLISLT